MHSLYASVIFIGELLAEDLGVRLLSRTKEIGKLTTDQT